MSAPALREALLPFALAGFGLRSGGPWGEVADEEVAAVIGGVPITIGDLRTASAAVQGDFVVLEPPTDRFPKAMRLAEAVLATTAWAPLVAALILLALVML